METKSLVALGKVAGIGGIALGVIPLLFQSVLKTKFLPAAGLSSPHAFAIILSLLVLTFGIAGIGIIAWLIGGNSPRGTPISLAAISLLSGLTLACLLVAAVVGAVASRQPLTSRAIPDGPRTLIPDFSPPKLPNGYNAPAKSRWDILLLCPDGPRCTRQMPNLSTVHTRDVFKEQTLV